MTQEELIQYWIDLANRDLRAAEIMLGGGELLYAGFMCHQAIEKIFKAHYQKEIKEIPPYIHNLELLANKSGLEKMLDKKQIEFLVILNPLNIEARYPSYKDKVAKSLTNEIMRDIISQTQELVKWTIKKL